MKQKVFINEKMTAMELLEGLGTEVTDAEGKIYIRMDAILEQVGKETFVVHYDHDEDVPKYLIKIKEDFVLPRRNLSEHGKNFLGEPLTKQHLPPGTRVMLRDDEIYRVDDKEWDGVWVPVTPFRLEGIFFHKADIELVRLVGGKEDE